MVDRPQDRLRVKNTTHFPMQWGLVCGPLRKNTGLGVDGRGGGGHSPEKEGSRAAPGCQKKGGPARGRAASPPGGSGVDGWTGLWLMGWENMSRLLPQTLVVCGTWFTGERCVLWVKTRPRV